MSWLNKKDVKEIERESLLSQQEYYNELYNHPIQHDDKACKAAIEYERAARVYDNSRVGVKQPNMGNYAAQHDTTIEAMKEHWRCVDRELGIDPDERINSTSQWTR